MRAALFMDDRDFERHLPSYDVIWVCSDTVIPGGKITTFNTIYDQDDETIDHISDQIFEHYESIDRIDVYNGNRDNTRSIRR